MVNITAQYRADDAANLRRLYQICFFRPLFHP